MNILQVLNTYDAKRNTIFFFKQDEMITCRLNFLQGIIIMMLLKLSKDNFNDKIK